MRAELLSQRDKNGIIVGCQLGTLCAALHISLPELAEIDFVFNPLNRRYGEQLAIDSHVKSELAPVLFPADVKYGIDVRYFAALLSSSEH